MTERPSNLKSLVNFGDHLNPEEAKQLLEVKLETYLEMVKQSYDLAQDVLNGVITRYVTLHVDVFDQPNLKTVLQVRSNITATQLMQLIETELKIPTNEQVLYRRYFPGTIEGETTVYKFCGLSSLPVELDKSKVYTVTVCGTPEAKWNKDAEGKCELEIFHSDYETTHRVKVTSKTTVKEVLVTIGMFLPNFQMWISRGSPIITRLDHNDILLQKWNPSKGKLTIGYT